ncbi:flagellin N-terminal helical domain-containing protein [Pararhizobium haloflavum]|uniref:flagellin N-terminal helical domain-containing protein n=1 Tax=Pararhizobium haloflavum TaxID=2037914 RepID=UPI000C1A4580|nr:flagellin [Pararhizobium haloflavum]
MSSIMTNTSSMAALQTLRSINDQMGTTQNRISSGLKVGSASDNAAYWSIATTMRSDNAAMSTVSDALGLGAAQVDIAYTAMESVKDTLDEIKTKLVAAQQPDVDKSKIQSEIKQLQEDLKTFASSATFSGGNWLDVSEAETQKVVASFLRDSNGVSLGTIDVDTAKTALFNSATDETGLLEQGDAITIGANAADDVEFDGSTAADTDPIEIEDVFVHDFAAAADGAIDLNDGGAIKFDININGEETRVTINAKTLEDAGITDGLVDSDADLLAAFNAALTSAGVNDQVEAVAGTTGGVNIQQIDDAGAVVTFDGNTDDANTYELSVSNVRTSDNGNFFEATGFDISSAGSLDLEEYMQGVDSMLSAVTTAASDLGAIKTRVDSQQSFVSKLMDAVDRGVGQLVDADMNEESTRLKALQTQQQLGIQALSIANNETQNILSLFR